MPPARITRYPDVAVSEQPRPDLDAGNHESRRLQEAVLANPADASAWERLKMSYDAMAGIWTDWVDEHDDYALPVAVGLQHAGRRALAVELSSGTGPGADILAKAGWRVLALDVSLPMLQGMVERRDVSRAVADNQRLPLATASVGLVVGLNAVFSPAELNRVCAPDGQILWCYSFGPDTPLYVGPEAFLDHLGPAWTARCGRAGRGEWLLAERRSP